MPRVTKAQFVKLQKKHRTDAAIGEEFGITRQAVHHIRKKYGIESSRANNPQRDAAIVKAYEAGKSGTAIAKEYKLSVSRTYNIIHASNGKTRPRGRTKLVGTKPAPVKKVKAKAKKKRK
ncbi:MAG: hypothetical protein FWE57_06250 [Chitinispirillia bacterium]|nr:hypothetical protein [Chitinispirillia bacterium]